MSSSINGLPGSLTGSQLDVDADRLGVYDQSAGTTKKITARELIANAPAFLQSGTAPTTRSVQDALRAMVRSGDFALTANFNTAVQALTETIGVRSLSFQSAVVTDTRRIFTWTPATAARGPFVMDAYEALFNGTRDPVVSWGYNAGADGAQITAGEPAMQWVIEGNYDDASGQNKMEAYLQYRHDGTTTVRPFFVQMNRSTGVVNTSRLKANTVQIIADDGTAGEGGANVYDFARNILTVYAPLTSGNTTISVLAAAAKSAILSLGNNAVADKMRILADASTSGQIEQGGRTIMRFYSTPNGAAGESVSVGVNDNSATGIFDSVNCANGVASLIARAKSSQSVVTFQVQDSTGTMVAGFNKDGAMHLKDGITAPTATAGFAKIFVDTADGDLKVIFGDGTTKTIVVDT